MLTFLVGIPDGKRHMEGLGENGFSGSGERWGHAVAQFIEALRYKPEGRGLDS